MTDALLQVVHAPLTAIALTLAAFVFALWLYRRTGWLVLQPVLITMLLLIAGIRLLQLDYAAYREAVVPISWLLGPTTAMGAATCSAARARLLSRYAHRLG